jgi:hypothetical protein
VHDLRKTLAPVYPDMLNRLLKLLPRQISASALTVLLATLSSLFKHLLVPDNLELTWTQLKETLVLCIPGVQKAVAEVWGAVMRRVKADVREKCTHILAEDVEGIDDTSVWILVFACKVRAHQSVFAIVFMDTFFYSPSRKRCIHPRRRSYHHSSTITCHAPTQTQRIDSSDACSRPSSIIAKLLSNFLPSLTLWLIGSPP